jgi:hypothetical protein
MAVYVLCAMFEFVTIPVVRPVWLNHFVVELYGGVFIFWENQHKELINKRIWDLWELYFIPKEIGN